MSDYHDLQPGTGPWKVDRMVNVGENWLIADMGLPSDGSSYERDAIIITTDNVRASEDECDPLADAEWVVWTRNKWDRIVAALDGQVIATERKRLDEWNAGLPLFGEAS